ncbi:phosphatidylinositol glycan anchor biosynthesis class X isoform X2 [Lycorma delicatula]|uniref:phosphatidylinositol glycan anchor biosynthesis class X isoform X2 n=1 Tax=Lycorma delicatula TaxID=130591 RepID=UPI003F515BEE
MTLIYFTDYYLRIFIIYLFMIGNVFSSKRDCQVFMHCEIENDSFHRLLVISVEIHKTNISWFYDLCSLAIHQTLPSGAYVDPEQLNELSHLGKVSNSVYYLNNTVVDVEASEESSVPINVIIYNSDTLNNVKVSSSTNTNILQYKFILPIHLRYHAPNFSGGYRNVLIPYPKVLLRCPVDSDLNNIISEPYHCTKHFHDKLPCNPPMDIKTKELICNDWRTLVYFDVNSSFFENNVNNINSNRREKIC